MPPKGFENGLPTRRFIVTDSENGNIYIPPPPKQANPDKYYLSKADAVAGLIMAGYPNSYIRKATGLHNGLINLIRKQIYLEKKMGEEAAEELRKWLP